MSEAQEQRRVSGYTVEIDEETLAELGNAINDRISKLDERAIAMEEGDGDALARQRIIEACERKVFGLANLRDDLRRQRRAGRLI